MDKPRKTRDSVTKQTKILRLKEAWQCQILPQISNSTTGVNQLVKERHRNFTKMTQTNFLEDLVVTRQKNHL